MYKFLLRIRSIIKSVAYPDKSYGYTLDVKSRLDKHNEGGSIYTKNHKPWSLVWYCSFESKAKALVFEAYLKSHSGRAFFHKRFL